MTEIISLESSRNDKNPIKHLWKLFQSFESFSKATIVTCLLIILSTPFIVVNRQTVTSLGKNLEGISKPNLNKENNAIEAEKMTLMLLKDAKRFKNKGSSQDLQVLKELAKKRKEHLLSLTDKSPEEALKVMFTKKVKDSLPPEIQDDIEEETTIQGIFEIIHADDFSNKKSTDAYFLKESSGKRVSLRFAKQGDTPLPPGAKIKVNGFRIDDEMIIANSSEPDFEVLSTTDKVLGVTTPTVKKVAVILFNFQDYIAQEITPQKAKDVTFGVSPIKSAKSYYKEASFDAWNLEGKLDIQGDVFGWYTIPFNKSSLCPYGQWTEAAKEEAIKAGVDLNGYDNYIFSFPGTGGCPGAGWAQLNGNTSWVLSGFYSSFYISHELGHNFGLHHAKSYNCTNSSGIRVTIDEPSRCTSYEYGDPFDVMGTSMRHLNNIKKGDLRYLEASNTQTITTSGTYSIAPIEGNTSDVQSLRIEYSPGLFYYLEYRQPYGLYDNFFISDPVVNGVSIRWSSNYTNLGHWSFLLDNTPETNSYFDSALGVGKVFIDALRNITVTTKTISPSNATVDVVFGPPPCIRYSPNITLSPSVQWGEIGETLTYSLTVYNGDTAACGSSVFEIIPSLPSAEWIQIPALLNATISPGTHSTLTFTLTSPNTADEGIYSFTEKVVNSSSPTSFAEVSANYNVIASKTSYIVDFDDKAGEDQAMSFEYPAGIINWVTSWWHYGPSGLFTSKHVSFPRGQNNGFITFIPPAQLVSMRAYNQGISDSTVTIQCSIPNLSLTATVPAGTILPITTNWTGTCSGIIVLTSNGWETKFDDIELEIVSSPTPTSTPTPSPTPTPKPTASPTPTPDVTKPTVSITSPTNGSTVFRNSTITIAASASDTSGIARVEFYVNGILTCTDTTVSYTCSWRVPGGQRRTFTLMTKAYDKVGNSASSSISVTSR